jgi:hypothetical protein
VKRAELTRLTVLPLLFDPLDYDILRAVNRYRDGVHAHEIARFLFQISYVSSLFLYHRPPDASDSFLEKESKGTCKDYFAEADLCAWG